MKKIFPLVGVAFAFAAVGYFPGQADAQTAFPANRQTQNVGHGHYIHVRPNHTYFPKPGPYGYGNYGVSDRWRSTPHWHYYPSGIYRRGNRHQYVEGHYEWHQEGPIPGVHR